MRKLLQSEQVQYQQRACDVDGRIVVTCRVRRNDLAEVMVSAELAVALPHSSEAYALPAEQARISRVGMWAGEFVMPSDFRASDPHSIIQAEELEWQWREREARTESAVWPPRNVSAQGSNRDTNYAGCREARAAGAAPLYRGQPGYRPEMDGDGGAMPVSQSAANDVG